MIDEYVVDYEEYPAIGSGGITYLGENLYVNTFSVREYNEAIEAGHMSHDGQDHVLAARPHALPLHDAVVRPASGQAPVRARLRHVRWNAGFPWRWASCARAGLSTTDNADELTLTPKGRYLVVVMMRQFFIGVNNLRDQARAALTGEERELIFGDGKRC